ncbi:hypothetical protein [Aliikangiella sp. IMCC44359]|uniref:hypothetical protein n=1 Tax=Aliikangiella sp. IMCC44359 TaxID=3459125 RepID=UPI00403AE99D
MKQANHQLFDIGLSADLKKQNNQEYCLMEWDGVGVAVNIGYVISVTLASEVHNNNLGTDMKLISLDRHFKPLYKSDEQRKQIVILQCFNNLMGLYCQKVAFTESIMNKKLTVIPEATKTKQSPILNLLQVTDKDYFTIDFEKFYQYLCQLEVTTEQNYVDSKI